MILLNSKVLYHPSMLFSGVCNSTNPEVRRSEKSGNTYLPRLSNNAIKLICIIPLR